MKRNEHNGNLEKTNSPKNLRKSAKKKPRKRAGSKQRDLEPYPALKQRPNTFLFFDLDTTDY